MEWVIIGTTDSERDPLSGEMSYWSNEWGWVTEGFTIFTDAERESFTAIPINGQWERF